MKSWSTLGLGLASVAGFLAGSFLAPSAQAAELTIFVAGAAKSAYEQVAPHYEHLSGNTLKPSFDTVGALRDRVLAGEKPDLVMLSTAGVDALAQRGLTNDAARTDIGVVVAGLAVLKGAPVPDISTPEALKQALLNAKSVGQADGAKGATSGAHFSKVIDALGVRDALAPKLTVLPFGVDVIRGVGEGKFEIGVSQSSEIVPIPDVTFVGGLPAPYALRTTYTAAAIGGSEAGMQMLKYLQSDFAKGGFVAAGLSAR
jgi:molybdate transport system substrate-binding protein